MKKTLSAVLALLVLSCAPVMAKKPAQTKIIPSRSVVVGGFDPDKRETLPALLKQLDEALPKMKAAGATSHEGYVRWGLIEPEKQGQFDFYIYDEIVKLYKKHGMKWVPFLIIGSPYSIPDWYYNSKKKQGYICLEHGTETDVLSLWNPEMRQHVDRVIKAFAQHYANSGVVESVLLGVTGNYGEAIYVATMNDDWTANVHGKYHTHHGYWAADPYAVKSFRAWLKAKYKTPAALNRSWKASFKSFDEISPALKDKMPSDRAWYDMITWYRESMNSYTDFWVATTRKYFPGVPVFICTGGDANPEHGSDFGEQSRIAAKYNAGVRITNEGSNYPLNFSITRWVASASNFYGGYFGFEPAGFVDEHGVVARIYNVAASAASQLHTYWGNVFDTPERKSNWDKWLHVFPQKDPVVDIALYYSKPSVAIQGAHFYEPAFELRDYFDYDIIDDDMITAGALKKYGMAVWPAGSRAEQDVYNALAKWIASGGNLVLYAGYGPLRTVDGAAPAGWPAELSKATDEAFMSSIKSTGLMGQGAGKALERLTAPYGKGRIVFMPQMSEADSFVKKSPVSRVLRLLFDGKAGAPPVTREPVDFEWDSVYFTLMDGGKTILSLSQNKAAKTNKVFLGGKIVEVRAEPDVIGFTPAE